ncbi:RDD family protein [Mycolicibacterium flavescens]|uniref:RDD domain-containing protein n=1 Tax=Mycolicibacterium flavescens TaxID=1776 RepID=A0A1E3RL30_MYCFV|nr:RDD family protein [Mycolicibacterium flavescens]MCV7281081.1 RDD family protein [Mycolicibacterium flavescens]ODQ90558.1 hypothetical protein BHQ18_09955 [Mycolicibacterium flavescens]
MTSPEFEYQPGPYGAPPAGRPGGLLLRWLARFIDGIIVGIVSWLLAMFTDNESSILVTGVFTGVLMFVYFFAFETTTGSTLGKKLLGLRVLGPGGAPKPTAAQSAIRNSWTVLPVIPFVGGLLGFIAIVVIAVTISGSPTKQGKHDQLAGGTQVVKG